MVRYCIVLQTVFAVLVYSFMPLIPALAVTTLNVGALELSWLIAAVGTGSVVGAVVVASTGRVEHRGFLMLAGLLLSARDAGPPRP